MTLASFAASAFASPMVESEFAFRLLNPLPARGEPYNREEVAAAAVLHLAIEIGDFRIAADRKAFTGRSPASGNPTVIPLEPLQWIADNEVVAHFKDLGEVYICFSR